jgi:hypothetical protein
MIIANSLSRMEIAAEIQFDERIKLIIREFADPLFIRQDKLIRRIK